MPMRNPLQLLKNKIDVHDVPFSYPGSRILIYSRSNRKLFFKLAERLVTYFPGIESYLTREPFIDDFQFIDEKGVSLSFEVTTWPHCLEFQTRIGIFLIVFDNIHTIMVCLPPHKTCGIKLKMPSSQWRISNNGGMINSYRNLSYSSKSKIRENKITSWDNQCELAYIVQSDEESVVSLTINEKNSFRTMDSLHQDIVKKAQDHWQEWLKTIPKVNDVYQEKYVYAWWALANNFISPQGNVFYDMAVPSKKSYIGIWLWDNAMHAIALRHLNPNIARDQIRGVLAHQLPDGMLPDAIFDDGVVYKIDHPFAGKVTKPPILAWAAWKIHEIDPDPRFIEEIYSPLVKWNHWWFDQNASNQDGIVQYHHPYSSGMDDHPSWDFGFPVDSPDINSYLVIQMQSLAKMAAILNRDTEAATWLEKSDALVKRMIDYFWCEESGLFNLYHDGKALPVFTILNLFPIWTGKLPHHVNQKILTHLSHPEKFGGDYQLPTVARNDPRFVPNKMWCGPVWANINYFFIEALMKIGRFDLAEHLIKKTMDIILRNEGIHEYYDANTGRPPRSAVPGFGWTAAVFIDLAIQMSNNKHKYMNGDI